MPLHPFHTGILAIFSLLALKAPSASWQLVWSDEFNGAANSQPSGQWWTYETGGGGWGNNELQCYTNSTNNVREDGAGHLIIEARQDSASCPGNNYTSARLKTQAKFAIAYGKVEAYAKVPSGQGFWPAFWMLGENIGGVGWPTCGEIDIMETVGANQTWIQGSLHGPGYSGGASVNGQYYLASGTMNQAYHLFGMEWDPAQIRFYFDGNLYYSITPAGLGGKTWVFDHPFFLLLNFAVGGNWPGNPDGSTVFPAQYLIDYVRVYKDASLKGPYGGTAALIPGRVEAERYDEGGYGLAYVDQEPANLSGSYRPNEWVDLENGAGTSADVNLDWTNAGEWEEYTINATASGSYRVKARVASNGNGGTFHLEIDGVDVSGPLTMPSTGGWASWADVNAGPFVVSAGLHTLRVEMDTVGATGSVGNLDCMDFTLDPGSPTPSPSASPTPSATASCSASPTPSASSTEVPAGSSPTDTPTATSSATAVPSVSPSPTPASAVTQASTGNPKILACFAVPNPSPDSLRVRVDGLAERVELRVYSSAYACLSVQNQAGGSAWVRVPFDASGLADGTYILKVVALRGSFSSAPSFVKIHLAR